MRSPSASYSREPNASLVAARSVAVCVGGVRMPWSIVGITRAKSRPGSGSICSILNIAIRDATDAPASCLGFAVVMPAMGQGYSIQSPFTRLCCTASATRSYAKPERELQQGTQRFFGCRPQCRCLCLRCADPYHRDTSADV